MKHFVIVALLVVACTIALHAGLDKAGLLPQLASVQGTSTDQLFGLYIWATAFVFSLIVVTLVYALIVFRRREGETGDGVHVTGNSKLEIAWTVVPLLVVIYLAFLGAQSLAETRRIDPSAMVVKVVTGQWYWQFQYPDYGVITTELYLPVGKQVDLQMTSTDVIHGFFVPQFRLKQDIVPGRTVDLRITPSELGKYTVECSQLCGSNHAYMTAAVVVVAQADFDAWVAKQKAAAGENPVLLGESLATQYGCAVCHSTDGSKKIGPTWLHLYQAQVPLTDGSKVSADAQYLSTSITDPNAQIVAGYTANVMPSTFGQTLDKNQIAALVAYIESLK